MASAWESTQSDGKTMDMYVSIPEGSGPFPGVVVIHHMSGVDPFTRSITEKLAGEGYAAVAPNLYHRNSEADRAAASGPKDLLKDPQVVTDVNAVVDYFRGHASVEGERLGVIGFCMGGRVVWLAAATNAHFKAAVPYYGGSIMLPWGEIDQSPYDRTNGISCPILFHFGELDVNPSPEDMGKLDGELTRLGKKHQFHTYPDAKHGFMNHNGPGYNKEATDAAWPRTMAFFAEHLAGVSVR